MTAPYWWCLRHRRVEDARTTCRADERLGPYATEAAARDWREQHGEREDAWEAEDERWHGTDEDDDEDDGWT